MHDRVLNGWRLAAAVACVLAVAPWPYAYFQLLRWLVVVASGLSAWAAFQEQRRGWAWTFVALAILFNPLAPIRLDRETWRVVDVLAGLVLASPTVLERLASRESRRPPP